MSDQYSKLSYTITKSLSKEQKKKDGIFFTPLNTIQSNLKSLKPYFNKIKNVLEPSCGTCEYINEISKEYKKINITGVELNKQIYDNIKSFESNKIKIINDNFLNMKHNKTYDLILGNPPYYVMKKKDVDPSYYEYFEGRPNIFIIFIIKSLQLLNDDGILSFVLPKNFLNCIYYSKTRKHICDNYKIIDIMICTDKYIETDQETIILIIQKKMDIKSNEKYMLEKNGFVILGIEDNITKMKDLYKNSTTLNKLKCKVNVGTVVWNQCKDILSNDDKMTRLIYSSDISNNELIMKKYKNNAKKNFIEKDGISTPLLVVNRGYGTGKYNFDYCLIEGGFEYLIENHLICIQYTETNNHKEQIDMYKKVIKSLNDKRTKEFIDLYFQNNAINTTELANILPIFLK